MVLEITRETNLGEMVNSLIDENIKLKIENNLLKQDNKWLEEELDGMVKTYMEDIAELKQINGLLENECDELLEELNGLRKYNDFKLPTEDEEMKMLKEFAKIGIYI